jgi:uncharacterized repeat protein (TIGR01451 family)
MANPCIPCSSSPHINTSSCPPQNGITVFQPACQLLPKGEVVNNPCFDGSSSYWTYKFFTDCTPGPAVNAISNFLIPICANIPQDIINVEERIDGFGQFTSITFSLSINDSNFGLAPSDFQWLKVENPGRYDKCVYVEYRITISDNFPAAAQAIRVASGNSKLTFCGNNSCFLVPACSPPGELSVKKACTVNTVNNITTLNYNAVVTNIGGQPLTNVQYNDVIIYNPTQFTLSNPIIVPSSPLSFVWSSGSITISGNIGTLNPNETFTVNYDIPVANIFSPGEFTISDKVTVSATDTIDTDSCKAAIQVVNLAGIKSHTPITNGNHVQFLISVTNVGASPATQVNILDRITIPDGVTVQFTSFGSSRAVFQKEGTVVPLYTDVSNAVIDLTCSNVTIASGGSVRIPIDLNITSVSSFHSPSVITNTLQQIAGIYPGQIFLNSNNIPVCSSVNVIGSAVCDTTNF